MTIATKLVQVAEIQNAFAYEELYRPSRAA